MAVQHPANGGRVIFDPKRDMPPAQTPGIIIGTAAAVIGVRVGLTYIVNLTSMYPTGRTGLLIDGLVALLGTIVGTLLVALSIFLGVRTCKKIQEMSYHQKDQLIDEDIRESGQLVLNVVVYGFLGLVCIISGVSFVVSLFATHSWPVAIFTGLVTAGAGVGLFLFRRWRRGTPANLKNLSVAFGIVVVLLLGVALLWFQGPELSNVISDLRTGTTCGTCTVEKVSESSSSRSATQYVVKLINETNGETFTVHFSANASNKLPVAIINEDSRVWVQWYPRTGIVFKAHVI